MALFFYLIFYWQIYILSTRYTSEREHYGDVDMEWSVTGNETANLEELQPDLDMTEETSLFDPLPDTIDVPEHAHIRPGTQARSMSHTSNPVMIHHQQSVEQTERFDIPISQNILDSLI